MAKRACCQGDSPGEGHIWGAIMMYMIALLTFVLFFYGRDTEE